MEDKDNCQLRYMRYRILGIRKELRQEPRDPYETNSKILLTVFPEMGLLFLRGMSALPSAFSSASHPKRRAWKHDIPPEYAARD